MENSLHHTTYHVEDTIHHVILKDNSRQAIDEVFDIIDYILTHTDDEVLRMLFDTTTLKDLPVMYSVQKAEQWMKSRDNLRDSRTAILLSQGVFVLTVTNLLMQLFSNQKGESRLFTEDQRDQAIAWISAT